MSNFREPSWGEVQEMNSDSKKLKCRDKLGDRY